MNGFEILKEAWALREGPLVFTTADQHSVPNSVYVLGMQLLDYGRIAVMDDYFNKTGENIKSGSKGSFLFLAKPGKPYQAKGSVEYLTSGPVYEALKASVDPKHPRVAAAVPSVEELYSGAEKIIRARSRPFRESSW
jgi:hypothetical protein